MMWLLLLACSGETQETGDTGPERGVDQLPLPDMSGMDLGAAVSDALSIALGVHAESVWTSHNQALALGSPGCPDYYFGDPVEPDEGKEFVGWADACVSSGGAEFVGDARWTSYLRGSEAGGFTLEGERSLKGDALVRDLDQTYYSFKGSAGDSLLQVQDTETEYSQWTWRSSVDGTLRGTLPMSGTVHPQGWRSDLSMDISGGGSLSLALQGNVYLFDPVLQERFDSMVVDMAWAEPAALGPDECELEPRGWVGVRTPDATWFHLVFQPRDTDVASGGEYDNDPYNACDGCATLYVRGVPQPDPICVDLSWLWADPRLVPPDPQGFVPDRRSL